MPILKISITFEEKKALDEYSKKELRDPRSQAYLFIRNALEIFGCLEPNKEIPQANNDGLIAGK